MDFSVLGFVLLAAALHAGWNTMVKMGGDKLVTIGLIDFFSGIVCLAALPFVPLPAAAAWPFIVASVVLHICYRLFLVNAYHRADMGIVYPIARGLAPALVALGAFVFAGEQLNPIQLAAISAITVAIFGLTFADGWRNIPLVGVAFALGTSIFIATYSMVDGMGGRLAGSPHAFYVWMSVIDSVAFTALVVWRRGGRTFLEAGKRYWPKTFAGGVMSTGAYWIVVWAMSLSPMAPVSAVRETSVLFGALLAWFVLKEGRLLVRITAAAVITLGVIGLLM
ncbi:MAG: EamA family transporter [Rhodospirillaceae bacterium]